MPERAKQYVEIPKGRPSKPCEACGTPLYFVQMPSRRWMPVEVEANDPEQCEPIRDATGLGVSHFGSCPEADSFRKRDKGK